MMVFPHFSSPIIDYEDIASCEETRTLMLTDKKHFNILGTIRFRHKRYVFIPRDGVELTSAMLDDIKWVIDRLMDWRKGIL